MKEWYEAKHRESSKEEINLINSIEPQVAIDVCQNHSLNMVRIITGLIDLNVKIKTID